jgi:hypothetical protein
MVCPVMYPLPWRFVMRPNTVYGDAHRPHGRPGLEPHGLYTGRSVVIVWVMANMFDLLTTTLAARVALMAHEAMEAGYWLSRPICAAGYRSPAAIPLGATRSMRSKSSLESWISAAAMFSSR